MPKILDMASEKDQNRMKIAIISVTRNGSITGSRLSGMIEADHFFPERYRDTIRDTIKEGIPFSGGLKELLEDIFYGYDGLIFIMATGIVVRSIAPFIKSKDSDPAVVVMDEKGLFSISLLSGHLGGANDLAIRIGSLIGAKPVITTATDINGLPSIDMMAKEFDLGIEDITKIKYINTAILEGEKIAVCCKIDKLINYFNNYPEHFEIYDTYATLISQINRRNNEYNPTSPPFNKGGMGGFCGEKIWADIPCILIDNRTSISGKLLPTNMLILRPKNLIVGIGCNRGAKKEEFKDLYFLTLKEYNLSPRSVRNIATMDIKKDEEGLIQFSEEMGLKIEFYSKKDLSGIALPSGISMNALINVGVGGVCEPAALLSAGAEGLLVKKIKRGNVTIAIAEAGSL